MSFSHGESPPRYGWQHVAFAIGVGALVVSLAMGLLRSVTQEGRLPGLTLDAYAEADALEARGDLQKALRTYEAASRISVGDAQLARRVVRVAARLGDVTAEIRALRQVASLEPRSSGAQAELAATLLRTGRAAEAADAYRRAVALEPRNAALHNSLGIALALAGRAREAAAEFEAALAITPDPSVAANLERARVQAQTGGTATLARPEAR